MGFEKSMGARAREAIEILWNDLPCSPELSSVSARNRYQAGVRWALRLVAIGFAESRRLLPVHSPVYVGSYSLHGLWRQLGEIAARQDHELELRFSAWPRLLSLVRLVCEGSSHPDLPIRPYGGELLEPGDSAAADGVARAMAVLEDPTRGPSDAVVWQILQRLCCNRRGQRIDFAALEADYVGQLYQAFLEGAPKVRDSGALELVRSRHQRKASGAFYTPLTLAQAVVERTLRPLCQDGDGPVPPEQLLQLRVCDPAMGSGAFLVAALRCLSEAAIQSLDFHGRLSAAEGKTVIRWGVGREFEVPLSRTDDRFQEILLAHVRRHVVECCLYGVDLDPISVELARFSLWLETMDRHLPLTFLSHKLKVGDSLVGASLADLETYPLRAWQAQAEHSLAARSCFEKSSRQLSPLATAAWQPRLPFASDSTRGSELQTVLARGMEKLQRLPVQFPDLKRAHYREQFLDSPARLELKGHLDTWCALWFWPPDQPCEGLLPDDWYGGRCARQEQISELAREYSFFHWELEFPEVFARRRAGFDAVVGNPPWEVIKGGNREANGVPLRALTNWLRGRHEPAGRFQKALMRQARETPFVAQGAGDTNTYKLFVEQGFALCRTGGRLGFIVPAGIYADVGAGELRQMLVSKGRWELLYGMDNRRRHFPIDGRFRFAVVITGKGGRTGAIRASFLNSDSEGLNGDGVAARWVTIEPAAKPRGSSALPPFAETATAAARQALEKVEARGQGVMVRGRGAWAASYLREHDAGGAMTQFFPVEHWLDHGWLVDSLGLLRPMGEVRPEQLALPVYQGTMIQAYDFAASNWSMPGNGRWSPAGSWPERTLEARFYMDLDEARPRTIPEYKVAVRRITNATNTRTVVAALVPPLPCTDKAAVLHLADPVRQLLVVAALNSFCIDASARLRCAGTQLDRHHLAALPLPEPGAIRTEEVALLALRLCGPHPWFAPLWLDLRKRLPLLTGRPWGAHLLHDAMARRRAVAAIEALVAEALGLTVDDLAGILADCNLSVAALNHGATRVRLDPRGFWRVDREVPPAERTTTLALEAFKLLLRKGPDALLATIPNGAGPVARRKGWAECELAALPVLELQDALRKRSGQQAALF